MVMALIEIIIIISIIETIKCTKLREGQLSHTKIAKWSLVPSYPHRFYQDLVLSYIWPSMKVYKRRESSKSQIREGNFLLIQTLHSITQKVCQLTTKKIKSCITRGMLENRFPDKKVTKNHWTKAQSDLH